MGEGRGLGSMVLGSFRIFCGRSVMSVTGNFVVGAGSVWGMGGERVG